MIVIPAIDIYDGKAVRLLKGDYAQMTVYADDAFEKAREIESAGAEWVHLVDLAGARDGTTPALDLITRIARETGLRVEAGGGIRTFETIDAYLRAGVKRVILGTKAVTDAAFLDEALSRYGDAVAVGVDAKDGFVAVKGWREVTDVPMDGFLEQLKARGVTCAIVTDIARDGAMRGTNRALYETLANGVARDGTMRIIASGGVSSYDDLRAIAETGLYGAILGKAMYTGAVDLKEALRL
ncbi:MAG: 1-(5-phosphoribosyl)-5-[Lachnospiraceae bacterium]|nr:1-(5-phosphoribosyl)-5-[(5-phosphoribosylamino)methylideneamino]imidazole-4-carboxamide isomerase [Lachnospiraceae bacterium]